MKVVLKNSDILIRKITALGSREELAAAAEAVGEHIRKHMIQNHLSGQSVGRGHGTLQDSFGTIPFTTPYPGATMSSDLRYAKILNSPGYAGRRNTHVKPGWFQRSIKETSGKHTEVAVKAWERARRGN